MNIRTRGLSAVGITSRLSEEPEGSCSGTDFACSGYHAAPCGGTPSRQERLPFYDARFMISRLASSSLSGPGAQRDFAVVLYSKVFRRGIYHVAWRSYFSLIQPDRERL